MAGAISGLTRYVVYGSGLLLALASLGTDASDIALVAGALGVGVGFGLQGIVANAFAGIVLTSAIIGPACEWRFVRPTL